MDIKKKRVMSYFIEAAEKILREDGIEGLSIRKIAAEAGYNSATLYNYFEDLEHLVLFASVRYLKSYIARLEHEVDDRSMNELEQYRKVYEIFSECCFDNPEIFHNMFFGKYRGKLGEVISQYYTIYPSDLGSPPGMIRDMLMQGDIYKRDMAFFPTLVSQGLVSIDKVNETKNLIIRTHQSFLYDALQHTDSLSKQERVDAFMHLFDYILRMAR